MPRTVEDELAGPTVFKDRAKLDYDWVPERLLHRDEPLRALGQLFRGVAEGTTSQRALITGGVGTGKTALAKYFSRALAETTRQRGLVIEHAWVNCRQNASEGLVLLKLLQHFDKNYPTRGYSTNEMVNDLRKHIDRRGVHFLVLLDEADALLRKEQDLVYALTRFDDQRAVPRASLSLLLVSARDDLHAMLDEATRSTVKRTNVIHLERYNAKQLRDIVADRVALAFHKGTVDEDVIAMVADIAGREGDARLAIELIEGAGQAADTAGAGRVDAEHVRQVKPFLASVVSEDKLAKLGTHPLIALLAVARKLGRTRRPYLTTGEAEAVYKVAAEEFGEEPRAHTQFWKYLKELETADWLHLERAEAAGSGGQTQHISLHDLPGGVLVQKVAQLLRDRLQEAH
jgi:archaeal cell division control protein 6